MELNKSQLDVLIKNLCVVIHTELENIGGEFSPSETISTLLAFDSFKALDYITGTIDKALHSKSESKEDSLYEDFLADEGYQKEMQKLENEIRNHIKTEQQMKLYADALEEKNEKLSARVTELKAQPNAKLDLLKSEGKKLKAKLSLIQKEISEHRKEGEGLTRSTSRTRLGIYSKTGEIDKKIVRAEQEHAKVSKSMLDTEKEYSQQKRDNEELKSILKEFIGPGIENQKEKGLVYKKKYEQKCLELEAFKKKLKTMETAAGLKGRSVTPTLVKNIQVQSQRIIRKVGSNEKLKSGKALGAVVMRTEPAEKKRLPLSFTARR